MDRLFARTRAVGPSVAVATALALGLGMVAAIPAAAAPAAAPAPPGLTNRAAAANAKPRPLLKRVTTGKTAVAAVGVDAIAARNRGMSRQALTTFLADPGARVNPDGALFFSDAGLTPGIPDGATGEPTPAVRPAGAAAIAPSAAFTLQSRPGSTKTIWLDFLGSVITNSGWNTNSGIPTLLATPFDRDGDPITFNDAERAQIIDTWAMVADDYAPFDVNVTTRYQADGAIDRSDVGDEVYGTHVVFTNSPTVQNATGCTGSCTGIAFLNGFDTYESATSEAHAYYQPAFVFTGYVGLWDIPTSLLGTVAAHEAGHTLGLSHDGTVAGGAGSYYGGQGPWSPIMGSAGERPITQFSNGGYTSGNNTEDDYAVMASHGLSMLPDDYPGTTTDAPLVNPAAAPVAGMITTAGDVDYLKFTSAGGTTTITASPATGSPDLDLSLEIRNSANGLVSVTGWSNPACATYTPAGQVISSTVGSGVSASGMGASVTATLAAGTYYAVVTGVGCGDLTTGYSSYGSRGRYTVSVGSPVLDVSVMGAGSITSSVGGINCGATCTAPIAATASAPTVVTLTAVPGAGQALSRWSGPCEKAGGQYWNGLTPTYVPSCKVTMDQSRSVTAVFSASTTLTVRSKGGIAQSPTDVVAGSKAITCGDYNGYLPLCSAPFGQASSVVVNSFGDPAQPTLVFKGWFGPCRVYNTVQCSVPMSGTRSVASMWGTSTSKVLAVTTSGSGTITSDIGGISCGATCETTFEPAASVVLTATPGLSQSFKGWGGACSGTATTCTLSMAAARSVTAVFGGSLSGRLAASTTGSGTVTSTPAGIDCGTTCFGAFAPGTVALKAVPNDGSGFVGWTSGCSGTSPDCSLTLTAGGASVAAQFTALPSLSSFSPTGGGGGATVTLNGSNLTYVSAVKFNGVAAASFTVVSDAKITAVTPAGVTSGLLTVTNPAGTVTVPGSPSFAGPPTIAGFSPAGGPVGTAVTVTGSGLIGVTRITFNGVAAGGIIQSDTSLSTTVPAGATTGVIRVTGTGGTATSATSFVVGSAPTVTALSPSSGPLAGGTSVTLTGTGFINGATTVKFGANAASSVTVNSATSVTATAPAGSAGTLNVTATTAVGTSATAVGNQYTYVAAPTVTSLSPASGPAAGGTSVILTGSGFINGATAVRFGASTSASVTFNSSTQVTATAPAGSAGTVNVTAVTAGGTSAAASGNQYTHIAAPTVSSLSPAIGPAAGGTSVIITGTNLTGATTVRLGANAATDVVVNSPTQITATSPAGTAGAATVTVTTPGGTSTNTVTFTYAAVPTVTALAPTGGPLAGGTVVNLTGTGFVNGATSARFGASAATNVVVNSATSITATSPAGAAGAATVTVTTPGGTSTNTVTFAYAAVPTVTSLSPASGPAAGGTSVTIFGTDLSSANLVRFGAKVATNVVVDSPRQITATSPSGSVGEVAVTVTTPGGTSTEAITYTYVAAPTVTSISPASGPVAGGTVVTLTGTGFASGTTTVSFGANSAASVTYLSATSIRAIAPAGIAGAVTVTATTSGGTSTNVTRFTYRAAPTVTALSPAGGPVAGGTVVTLTGTGFVSGATTVRFGANSAASVTYLSATSIRAIAPAGIAGAVTVAATTSGGTSTNVTRYTYAARPTVTGITPTSVAIGRAVTITGTNLSRATSVKFGTVSATRLTVISSTKIVVGVPSGSITGGRVTVTTPGGRAISGVSYALSGRALPTVTSLTATRGPVGTLVTVSGANVGAAIAVRLTGVTASFTVLSATSLRLKVPAGARTGVVSVTTAGGSANSATSFTVTLAASPLGAPAGRLWALRL